MYHIWLFWEKGNVNSKPMRLVTYREAGSTGLEEGLGVLHFSAYNFLCSFDFWNQADVLHTQKNEIKLTKRKLDAAIENKQKQIILPVS